MKSSHSCHGLIFSLLGLLLLIAGSANGQTRTTYTYAGNPFDHAYNEGQILFDRSSAISGNFSVDGTLTDGTYDFGSTQPLGFSLLFSNTLTTFDTASFFTAISQPGVVGESFKVTIAQGNVTSWYISLGNLSGSSMLTTHAFGGGLDEDSARYSSGTLHIGSIGNSPGLWSTSILAVPEPETYAMLLAGLGLLSLIIRRKTEQQANA